MGFDDPENWWTLQTGDLLVPRSGSLLVMWPPDGDRRTNNDGNFTTALEFTRLTPQVPGLIVSLNKTVISAHERWVTAILLINERLWWIRATNKAP